MKSRINIICQFPLCRKQITERQRFSISKNCLNSAKVITLTFLATVLFSFSGYSQISITGPTCANPGSSQTYTISGNWNSSTYMSWSVSGGTITSGSSGTPYPQIHVTWNSNYSSGTVSVSTSNPYGSASKNVSKPAALTGGTISNPTPPAINYNSPPPTINCPVAMGGSCSASYSYQWQQSSSIGGTYVNVSSTAGTTTSQNLSFTSGYNLTATTYYRRRTIETTTNTTAYSTVATVTVYPDLDPGTISPSSVTITPNTSPGQLTGSTPTGGSGTYTYLWYSSSDGTNWTQISPSVTSLAYTPPALTSTTYYHIAVTSNSLTKTTPTATVTVSSSQGGVQQADNLTGSLNSDMNWIIETGYDVSGNILKQDKNFFDNGGRLIQSQQKVFYRKDANTVYTHVFASQPVRDVYGRGVLSTMWAPIDYAEFNYMPNFVKAADGSNYTYKNFDRFNASGTETDKTNNPDAIGSQDVKGTLGWYYGPYNTWEPYTPTSNYPYSRSSIYKDGTNRVKKEAGTGETFDMGSNHELSDFELPVSNELNHYIAVRNKFFSSNNVGNEPSNLIGASVEFVKKDENGNESIIIKDKEGNILMAARPGTELVQSPTVVTLSSLPNTWTLPIAPSGSGCSFPQQSYIYLYGAGSKFTVTNTSNYTVTYTGPLDGTVVPITSTDWGSTVKSDEPFSVVYTDYQTSYCSPVSTQINASSSTSSTSIYYFKIFADATPVAITGSGTYTLYDMSSELTTNLINGNSLNKGYYKLVANIGTVNLSFSNSFTDVSYNFYNHLGQLVGSISPNGVKLLIDNGLTAYSTLASIPFVSMYTYDSQGRLVSATTPDAGTSKFSFRKDGRLRFSQSSLQATNGSYSYTNYDNLGRPIETGQYDGSVTSYSTASTTSSILESTDPITGGLGNGTKTDVVMTTYDVTDNSYGTPLTTYYSQDANNMGGMISTTRRYSSVVNNATSTANLVCQTWYNYDEEGKLLWQIKYISTLGSSGYKTTDYTFDNLDRLTKVIFQKNTSSETFVHYYDYDAANGKLLDVYTNTTDNKSTATLQAKYIYNLQGQLKRLELGGNLQGIDYTYTLQGSLKAINNSNAAADPGGDGGTSSTFAPDVFGEVLDYYPNDYSNSRTSGIEEIKGVNTSSLLPTESYAGNIKAMTWYSIKPQGFGSNSPITYVYNYDSKYQFIGSTWGNSINFSNTPATFTQTNLNQEKVIIPGSGTPGTSAYDLNGNIQYLQRTGSTGATTDLFAYTYANNNNQVTKVVNTGSVAETYNFSYDAIGRETAENSGTTATTKFMKYDVTGKVTMVARDAGFTQPLAKFVYDEMNNRIEKISYNSSYQPMLATFYFGNVVYSQTITSGVYGTLTPQEYGVSAPSGRLGIYNKASDLYTYELRDHLGNIRAVIAKTGAVQTAEDYYPFGMVISTLGSNYRYGYQGQTAEADGETSLNSFELRMYNPRLAKWITMDPRGQYFSPYIGMGNDPVNGIDPDGGNWWDALKAHAYHLFHPGSVLGYSKDESTGKYYYNIGWANNENGQHYYIRRFEDRPTNSGMPFHLKPWFGITVSVRSIKGVTYYTDPTNPYLEMKAETYNQKVYKGAEGILGTINFTYENTHLVSIDENIGPAEVSLDTKDLTVSAGVSIAGTEVHGSVISANPLSLSKGFSIEKDGTINGSDFTISARSGTYVLVGAAIWTYFTETPPPFLNPGGPSLSPLLAQ